MKRAIALALLVAVATSVVLLYATIVLAADGEPVKAAEAALPIGAGGLGAGAGAGVMWWWMHGRLKTAETQLAQLPALTGQLSALAKTLQDAIDDFKAYTKGARLEEQDRRNKISDVRDRVLRVEERFNGLRDVVADIKGTEAGLPRQITDQRTDRISIDDRDTGPRRRVPR